MLKSERKYVKNLLKYSLREPNLLLYGFYANPMPRVMNPIPPNKSVFELNTKFSYE